METPETVEIFIVESDHSPVHASVNGRLGAVIPVGKNTRIDARLLAVIENTPGIKWRIVGQPLETPEPAVDPGFDADAIIAGTVSEVEVKLASLTPQQLLSVRDAETDREVSRKGVHAAIDKLIAESNQE